MKEIELKILNINVPAIRRKLKRLGLKQAMKPTLFHELLFTSASSKGKEGRFSLFRLRKEGKKSFLAIKVRGKKNVRFDVKRETEVLVSDFISTRRIIETVGFKVTRERQKIREEYVGRGIKIEIDKYPKLEPYVEIEGRNTKMVLNFLSAFGYSLKNTTSKTATEILKEAGIDDRKLVFRRKGR